MSDDGDIFAREFLSKDSADFQLEPVTDGMSGAWVYRATWPGRTPCFLKIADADSAPALRDEIARTQWLAARGIRVPRIVRTGGGEDHAAMLAEQVPGLAGDDDAVPPVHRVKTLALGLKALHALMADNCPFDESFAARLARATNAVESGDVDAADFEPHNRGVTPEALLKRLSAAIPPEDFVIVHGDASLNNFMIGDDGTLGFIDCGTAGRGDRYLDLALVAAEVAELHGGEAATYFVATYGLQAWDIAKARYCKNLYELF